MPCGDRQQGQRINHFRLPDAYLDSDSPQAPPPLVLPLNQPFVSSVLLCGCLMFCVFMTINSMLCLGNGVLGQP